LLWAIWLSQNDIASDKKNSFVMQIIYKGTHWTRLWPLFQKEEEHKLLQDACHLLETVTMENFAKKWMAV
jgi:hypothetical protein